MVSALACASSRRAARRSSWNDLGGGWKGEGTERTRPTRSSKRSGGGAARRSPTISVEDGDKIVQTALDTWKRVDIVINNAGILRDTSFQKMTDEDWELIYRVHVRGTYKVTKAAWDHMRDAGLRRIIMTASAAGIYGNWPDQLRDGEARSRRLRQHRSRSRAKKNVHRSTPSRRSPARA